MTERSEAEMALRESQQQLAMALDVGQLGFWDWDITSGKSVLSGRWLSMLGYQPGELEPDVESWRELIHPDDRNAVSAILTAHLEGRIEFYECEHRLRHKDGS